MVCLVHSFLSRPFTLFFFLARQEQNKEQVIKIKGSDQEPRMLEQKRPEITWSHTVIKQKGC